jgi:hypothetical protein
MEGVMVELIRVYGPPGAISAAVIYYLMKREPEKPQTGSDNILAQMAVDREARAEDRRTLQDIRDRLIRIEAKIKTD